MGQEPDLSWMKRFCTETGRVLTFAIAQTMLQPTSWRETLAEIDALCARGLSIAPQVACRPTGLLYGLESSLHPFSLHPTYRTELAPLPLAEPVVRMRESAMRARMLAETIDAESPILHLLLRNFAQMFPLGNPPQYEPDAAQSVGAIAEREGRTPEAVAYDLLLAAHGKGFLFAPRANYLDYDFEAIREMMLHPRTVLGLSDGGAHCGLISDASMPTFLLTHWARDRRRGKTIPIEQAVRLQTHNTARAYGFVDRGTIEVGMKADVNLIDLDAFHLQAPKMVYDLPASGRRLAQRVDGYRATVVSGEVTFENGEPTGALPGRLVRAGSKGSLG